MKKLLSNLNSGLVVAIIALVINIITVGVYVSQTSIMKEQQKAAVWPHLEWRAIYNQDSGFVLRVQNNGVGPALVKNSELRLDGKPIQNLDSLFIKVLGTRKFPHTRTDIDNRVLAAGSSTNLLKINDLKQSELFFYKLKDHEFKFTICYESIYEEQWTCHGVRSVKGNCK